jgi:hypothetical protein
MQLTLPQMGNLAGVGAKSHEDQERIPNDQAPSVMAMLPIRPLRFTHAV